jgi:hypothetical protein
VHDGAAEQFSFLLVEQQQQQQHATDSSSDDSDQLPTPRVHVLPDTPSVTAAVAAGASNTFFWLQQQQQQQEADATTADTVLQGFSLAAGAAADGKGLLPVVPAWRVVLPGKLLAMASRDPTEPVHSYVKVRAACLLECLPCLPYSFSLCACLRQPANHTPHCNPC